MITDLDTVDGDPFKNKKFDVCICGAGVTGITLALKLSRKLNVILLEGGGFEYTDHSQDLYFGKSIGQDYFDLAATRLRYFGGTSNHWAGWCHPLDSHDFTSKPYVKHSGWPIERSNLDPYLKEAEYILDITEDSEEGQRDSQEDIGNTIGASTDFRQFKYKWSAPTRFGEKYKAEIERLPHLACYLNANIVDMSLFENLSAMEHVEVRNFTGKTFKIHAQTFVLAAGGIENPRILLNCNSQIQTGLGNDHDLVGRFFTEHPNKTVASFVLEDKAKEVIAKNWTSDRRNGNWYFSPSRNFMDQNKILNFGILVELHRKPNSGATFNETLKSLVCRSQWAQSAAEKLQGDAMDCPSEDGWIRIVSEQAPNPWSRVNLGQEVDRFGMRRVVLDWKLSEIDKRTIQRATIRLGEIFAGQGLGRLHIDDWLVSEGLDFPDNDAIASNHHMCTTRMGETPRDGVVDPNQRVFGIDNLYVGGSSVFATSGFEGPTITIVQMTLRLADHLNTIHGTHI